MKFEEVKIVIQEPGNSSSDSLFLMQVLMLFLAEAIEAYTCASNATAKILQHFA
jgi:hypothetical protein